MRDMSPILFGCCMKAAQLIRVAVLIVAAAQGIAFALLADPVDLPPALFAGFIFAAGYLVFELIFPHFVKLSLSMQGFPADNLEPPSWSGQVFSMRNPLPFFHLFAWYIIVFGVLGTGASVM